MVATTSPTLTLVVVEESPGSESIQERPVFRRERHACQGRSITGIDSMSTRRSSRYTDELWQESKSPCACPAEGASLLVSDDSRDTLPDSTACFRSPRNSGALLLSPVTGADIGYLGQPEASLADSILRTARVTVRFSPAFPWHGPC